jgi:hypothetical protein
MNPAIKGYFKLDASRYALISELEVKILYGLKPRCSLAYSVWTWFDAQCKGLPTVYKLEGEIRWYVDLEPRTYSEAELEALAITQVLQRRQDPLPRLIPGRPARQHPETTPDGDTQGRIDPGTAIQVQGVRCVERLVRDLDTHELKQQPSTLDYTVFYRRGGKLESYVDTLSYNSIDPGFCQSTLAPTELFKRCAQQFIDQHLCLATTGT